MSLDVSAFDNSLSGPIGPKVDPDAAGLDEASMLLHHLQRALSRHANKSVFAVGGTLKPDKQDPIVIRWDVANGAWDRGRGCVLPPRDGDDEQIAAFDKLLEDCKPATFGMGSKDVLDEEYRKAGVLDRQRFATNFNLAEYGILDAITQALVQGHFGGGVSAELYKLNVSVCCSAETVRCGSRNGKGR